MSLAADELVEVLRGVGEPTRLRILALLTREELSVMEISQILAQSQPRVSRHLKLLTEAGLVERFPDGAWVFYRLATAGPRRELALEALSRLDPADRTLGRDLDRLADVNQARASDAAAYFERNASQWDEVRSLYVAEDEVEAAILKAAGRGPYQRLVDLGTGSGRMLTLLGRNAVSGLGLDLSQQMLNIARREVAQAGLESIELRHGDIFATRLADGCADLVVIHRVLHFLTDPGSAVAEAARLVALNGQLLIVDFAPHQLEHLRQAHQHRRLGFSDEEIVRWCAEAGLEAAVAASLPSPSEAGLTVKVWTARPAAKQQRNAA